jgi:C4-dicarboxylate-specific signal transduction histidine kinase
MAISDYRGANEPEIRVQERIAELEKANQALRTEILEHESSENELIKLKDQLKAEIRDLQLPGQCAQGRWQGRPGATFWLDPQCLR